MLRQWLQGNVIMFFWSLPPFLIFYVLPEIYIRKVYYI